MNLLEKLEEKKQELDSMSVFARYWYYETADMLIKQENEVPKFDRHSIVVTLDKEKGIYILEQYNPSFPEAKYTFTFCDLVF